MITITVSNKKNDECDYTSIAAAFNALPDTEEPATIIIKEGIYHECLELERPNVTLIGDGPERTEICYNRYALQLMPDGQKRGTFRTPTLFINADRITVKNLTVRNSAGSGRKFGQALAVYADGDQLTFENVHLIGSQDTLFTGPLPPTAYEIGGFTGPKEFCPRRDGRHLYSSCYIEGDVDFIFGSATCWFEDCEIFSRKNDDFTKPGKGEDRPIYGYATAASTPEGKEFGYVFYNCNFTSDCPKGSVYLGRPWRNYAKTVLLNCNLGEHINEAGWHDWGKEAAHESILYAEFGSSGPGASDKRAGFAKLFDAMEVSKYTRHNVIGF